MTNAYDLDDDGPTAGAALAGPEPRASHPAPDVPPEIPLDAEGRVDAEVQCRRCGYVLMRQFPDADCPECGHAVIDSLRGGVLRFTDPRYLDRLWTGVGIMIGYVVAWFLCLILGWVFAMMVGPWGLVVWVIPPLVLAVAVWRLTSFDPGRPRGEQPNRWRVAARAGAIVACVMLALTGAVPLLEMSRYPGTGLSEAWLIGSAGVFEGLRAIGKAFAFVGLLVCVRYVAKRVPSRALASQAMVVAWGVAAAGAVGLVGKLAYGGAILMMFNSMSSGMGLMGVPVPTPTRPSANPTSTFTQGPDTVETWEVKRPDGSKAELTITTEPSGEQMWSEMVYDASGNMLAWRDVVVDAQGQARDDMGHGPIAALEFLGPQAAAATGQPLPGSTVSAAPSARSAPQSSAALPPPPTRPPDTTRRIGQATHATWHTQHADGSSDIYTEQRQADGSRVVTEMRVTADGSSTTQTYQVDAAGQVTATGGVQHAAPAVSPFAGGLTVAAVLMVVGTIGMMAGGVGFLVFFIWLLVLLCLLRPKLREARQFARALATPHFARYA